MSRRNHDDRRGNDRETLPPRRDPAREQPRAPARPNLNEYFIDGDGIDRAVLQIEICKYLGAEATCRPGDYNGRRGYKIKALRPFTPEMLDDLKALSASYRNEAMDLSRAGYEGSPKHDSVVSSDSDSVPDQEISYDRSATRQNGPSSSGSHYSSDRHSQPGPYAQSNSPFTSSAYATPSMYTSGPPYIPSTGAPFSSLPAPPGISIYPGSSMAPEYRDPSYTYSQPSSSAYQQPYQHNPSAYASDSRPRETMIPGYPSYNGAPGMPGRPGEEQYGTGYYPPSSGTGYPNPPYSQGRQPQYEPAPSDRSGYNARRDPSDYTGHGRR